MHHRRIKRFRYRSNSRSYQKRNNGGEQASLGSTPFLSDGVRNNFKMMQSAEKFVEKYNTLGKEALTSGDKILSENYSQHADHFMRVVDEKNLNQNKISIQVKDESNISEINSTENNKIHQDKDIKEKKE